jgi:hypothetical protein
VDVRGHRKAGGVDLHHRTDHDEGPVRAGRGRGREQGEIEALVHDAGIAEAGSRDFPLIGRRDEASAGAAEMSLVDARRKGVDIVVDSALDLEDCVAAGQHEVGGGEERSFVGAKVGRSEVEGRELVHAVVDDRGGTRGEVGAGRPEHRAVKPEHRGADSEERGHLVE